MKSKEKSKGKDTEINPVVKKGKDTHLLVIEVNTKLYEELVSMVKENSDYGCWNAREALPKLLEKTFKDEIERLKKK